MGGAQVRQRGGWVVWFPDPSCMGGRERGRKGLETKLGGGHSLARLRQ